MALKAGDIVVAKLGSVNMTVHGFNAQGLVICKWTESGRLKVRLYNEDNLILLS